MILNFRSRVLERVFAGDARGVQPNLVQRLDDALHRLHTAQSLSDLTSLPGFHPLSGNRRGSYAVTVTRNWRVIFTPVTRTVMDPETNEAKEEFHVRDVEYSDYH